MSLGSTAALFGAMILLALVPSVSVLTVSARAAASGFRHGAAVALGIVTADLLFILAAVYGLAVLAEAMGQTFDFVRYAGGTYLVVLGIGLLHAARRRPAAPNPTVRAPTMGASFMLGLLVTLGDQKAILFYLGFLPAFVDLATVSATDIALIVACTVLAVGGAKLAYAWAGSHAGTLLDPASGSGAGRWLGLAAGIAMIAVGAVLLFGG
jgi:threonine/homoserine/homoserine lactone efflux protein